LARRFAALAAELEQRVERLEQEIEDDDELTEALLAVDENITCESLARLWRTVWESEPNYG
jgi:hypothetical protein